MKRSRPTTLEPISASMFVVVAVHVAIAGGLAWWWHDHGALQLQPRLTWMKPSDFSAATLAPTRPAVTQARSQPVSEAKAKPAPSTEEPVQKATLVAAPPEPQRMEPVPNDAATPPLFAPAILAPKPSANRSITLRRVLEKPAVTAVPGKPAPPMTSSTLLDIARLNTLRANPTIPPPANVSDPDAEVNLDAVDEALNAAFLAHWTAPPLTVVPEAQREARLNISIGRDGTVLKSQMSKFSGSHDLDQSIIQAAAQVKKIPTTLPSNYSKDSYDLELNFLLLP